MANVIDKTAMTSIPKKDIPAYNSPGGKTYDQTGMTQPASAPVVDNKQTDTTSLENEAKAAYTATKTNQNVKQPNSAQPTYTPTSYMDANGVTHEGLVSDGRTYDANGNEISGEFYVASPNGTYWKRNADGSSMQIDAAAYNAVMAGGLSDSVQAQQNAATVQNTPSDGRFWTTITDADGSKHQGYILNGQSYYADGTPIRGGSTVVDSQGRTWTKAVTETAVPTDTANPYGVDYDALRQDYTAPEAPDIVYSQDASHVMSDEELAKMAMQGYQAANVERAESLYQRPEMPETRASDYEGQDFTEQINNVYEKKFDTVKAQIENQVKLGELDIDQALEKLPQIYDASANDISSQFEISKRNYNEYAAANGLSSGAKAQALLAMNNVYNANLAALRQEQANAAADYDNQRARLKLEAQGKITEALMQNETEKAQAILEEYNRQEQQNFELFLQGLEQDYKYYALEVDTALKEEQLREEQFQYDTSYNQKERMAAEESRQYALSLLTDLRKLEESARTADNATRVQLYNIENSIREFEANYGVNIAQLEQNAMIAREEADLARDKFAEAQYEFAQGYDLDLQKAQRDWQEADRNAALKEREFEEGVREFDANNEIKWADIKETIRSNLVKEAQNQQEIDITRSRYIGKDNGDYTPTTTLPEGYYNYYLKHLDDFTYMYSEAINNEIKLRDVYEVADPEAMNGEYIKYLVKDYAKQHAGELVTDAILDDAEANPDKYNLGYGSDYFDNHMEEVVAEKIVWDYLNYLENTGG